VKSLAVRSVTKDYRGGHRALRDVSFELGPGVVGLLGRNGAGKTTLLRLMSGLLLPTRGQVLVRGVPLGPVNIESFRGLVGYLPQEFNAYPGFTGLEFLEYWAIERGMDDRVARRREIEELLDVVGLSEHGRRKVRDYSGGMRQRVGIARALLGAPPILIVDEPTTGLDVDARARFREVLLRVASRRVVVFSTHLAADVEAVATRLLLLHRGRLIFDGAPQTLVSRARGRVFEALVADHDLREVSRRYRLVARVRTLAGIRVRGVAPPGVPLPGPAVEPRLEEAYLAEVEAAELAAAVGLAPS
jgi:ABC-type multidrug transport system ATPase subunit